MIWRLDAEVIGILPVTPRVGNYFPQLRHFDAKGKEQQPSKSTKRKAKTKKTKAAKTAKRGYGPSGKVVDILKLTSRPNGVSRQELIDLTKWQGAPWKWLLKNPKGTGYCDRHGYTLRTIEGKDGEVRYCTTKR
jgi:hypothetical protein